MTDDLGGIPNPPSEGDALAAMTECEQSRLLSDRLDEVRMVFARAAVDGALGADGRIDLDDAITVLADVYGHDGEMPEPFDQAIGDVYQVDSERSPHGSDPAAAMWLPLGGGKRVLVGQATRDDLEAYHEQVARHAMYAAAKLRDAERRLADA